MRFSKESYLDLLKLGMKSDVKGLRVEVKGSNLVFCAGGAFLYAECVVPLGDNIDIDKPVTISGSIFLGILPYLFDVDVVLKAHADYLQVSSDRFNYKLDYLPNSIEPLPLDVRQTEAISLSEDFFKAIDFAKRFVSSKKDRTMNSMTAIRNNSALSYNGTIFSMTKMKDSPDFKSFNVEEILQFFYRCPDISLYNMENHFVVKNKDSSFVLALAKPSIDFPEFESRLQEIEDSISLEFLVDREVLKSEVDKALLIIGGREDFSDIIFTKEGISVVNAFVDFQLPVNYTLFGVEDGYKVSLPLSLFKEILPAFPFSNIKFQFSNSVLFVHHTDDDMSFNVVVSIQGK